jgi:glycolate oxidase iron-sulfur subunit
MLLLEGCVQPSMAPNINSATARVLDASACSVRAAQGRLLRRHPLHLNDQDGGLDDMRRNIDAWWPYIEGRTASAPTPSS